VTVVPPIQIVFEDVDVLAPCALGNVLTSVTIPKLRAKVVAGAANNQLSNEDDGARLADRGILYAPDYVINAGGIVNVAYEYFGKGDEDQVRAEVEKIPHRLTAIFDEALETGKPTNLIANKLARRLVNENRRPS
jgi:leucine dehydrogenase